MPFAKADQARMRQLNFEQSQIPPAGRVMFAHGHKILGHGDVEKLGDFLYIRKDVDTVCVSAADYHDVKEWLDGK